MSFTISGTSGINLGTQPLTGSLPDANAPSGSIVQIVQGTTTTYTMTTSTSYVTTNITASITPTSASNKIVVFVSSTVTQTAPSKYQWITVYRNGTNIGGGSQSALSYYDCEASSFSWVPMNIMYVDSPASTSSQTYTVYMKGNTGATCYISPGDHTSSIILMEIAA